MKSIFFALLMWSVFSSFILNAEDSPAQKLAAWKAGGDFSPGQFSQVVSALGSGGIPQFIDLLSSSKVELRLAAMQALDSVAASCTEAGPAVGEQLQHRNMLVRSQALLFLYNNRCSQQKIAVAQMLSNEKDLRLMTSAIDALGVLGDASQQSLLADFQNNTQLAMTIRLSAVRSLLMLKGSADETLIRQSLQSSDEDVVLTALQAAEYAQTQEAITWVKPFQQKAEPLKTQAFITSQALNLSLVKTSNAERMPILFSLLDHENAEVRRWAASQIITRDSGAMYQPQLENFALNVSNPHHAEAGQVLVAMHAVDKKAFNEKYQVALKSYLSSLSTPAK